MAITPANKADWNRATDASALENASLIATNDNGESLNIWIKLVSFPPIIVVYPL